MKKKEILSPILLCISACILVVITVLGNNQTVYAQGNEGWSYDESTHTLSLMNYTYRDAVNEDDNIVQIYADGDLNIVVEGTNTLALESDYGIYCEGNLTISGTGSLEISNAETAIYATKGITINDCIIDCGTDIYQENSIHAYWGDVVISNATIKAPNDIVAGNANNIEILSGIVNANKLTGYDITINGGTIRSAVDSSNNTEVNGGDINIIRPKYVSDGKIYYSGSGIYADKWLKVNGGTIRTEEGCSYQDKAVVADYMEMTNGEISLKGMLYIENGNSKSIVISGGVINIESAGLHFRGLDMSGGQINIVATNTAMEIGQDSLYMSGGSINITSTNGTGIKTTGYGSTVFFEGGTIEITAAGTCIDGYGAYSDAISIAGSEVVLNGNIGIGTESTVSVQSGNLNCTGSEYGISAGNINICGGEVYSAGGIQALRASNKIVIGENAILKTGKYSENLVDADEYCGEKCVSVYWKINPVYELPSNLSATCDQTLGEVLLPEGFLWEDVPTTSVGVPGNNIHTVQFVPQDTERYNIVPGIKVYVAVAEHNYGEWNVIKEATVQENGFEKRVCILCENEDFRTIPKKIIEGWKRDNKGWWYQNADGSYPYCAWKQINGTWYYFNASGYMVTGWQFVGGIWYYFNGSGAMVTGWLKDGGIWYYFNGSGTMVTGWQLIGGVWYYFHASGAMAANQWVGNYYLQADGSMATNKWIGKYYVGSNGCWIP